MSFFPTQVSTNKKANNTRKSRLYIRTKYILNTNTHYYVYSPFEVNVFTEMWCNVMHNYTDNKHNNV